MPIQKQLTTVKTLARLYEVPACMCPPERQSLYNWTDARSLNTAQK